MATGSLFIRPLPFDDELIITKSGAGQRQGLAPKPTDVGKATDALSKWAEGIQRQAGASPVSPNPAEHLTAIVGSSAGTIGGAIPAGIYVVYAYREVIAADPVSSSLGLTLSWTHNGKAMTRTLSAFGGAPQTVNDSVGDAEVIVIDPNTSIGYTLTYASNTPGLAQFEAFLMANLLQTIG